jgi:hypothetical protein
MTTEVRAWHLDFSAHGSKETANPGTVMHSEGKERNSPLGSLFGEDTQVNYQKTATKKCKKIKRTLFLGRISIVTTLDNSDTDLSHLVIKFELLQL